MAAPTRPANSGCGRLGRDLNSGWYWHGDEPRMVLQLYRLHQIALGIHAGDGHARGLQTAAIVVVELEAMAMALDDLVLTAVQRAGLRALGQAAVG